MMTMKMMTMVMVVTVVILAGQARMSKRARDAEKALEEETSHRKLLETQVNSLNPHPDPSRKLLETHVASSPLQRALQHPFLASSGSPCIRHAVTLVRRAQTRHMPLTIAAPLVTRCR